MRVVCQVCGSSDWLDLPDPVGGRTVTTAGRIIGAPLGKAQCAGCGFVQRTHARFLGHTDYYEQDYAGYYDRPGTSRFHAARYRILAEWMVGALGALKPARIIDIGCGQGWTMEAMKSLYPHATIEGLEPSTQNSAVARARRFMIHEARLGEAVLPAGAYDLIYSNNVIQHVTDVRHFLGALKELTGDHGVVVITCPDGSVPNIELLWGDQNYSLLPGHLRTIACEAGFITVRWFASPPSPSLPPAQMLLLSARAEVEGPPGTSVPPVDLDRLYQAKRDYLGSFRAIDAHLCDRIAGEARVYNFGASYWSSILAVYCPEYWRRVTACVVEGATDPARRFFDKSVKGWESIATEDAIIVLGTSPSTHAALQERLQPRRIVAWDQFAPQS